MSPNIVNALRRIRIRLIRVRALWSKKITLGNRTLIIAPHPDDEVIGCGGLIARLCADGRPPHVIIMTRGENSHQQCCDTPKADTVAHRHAQTVQAAGILRLPADHILCLDFSDGDIAADMTSDKAAKLRGLIEDIKPDSILAPHWGEGWPDHVNAAKMVREIATDDTEIYEYCVWMWYYNVWRLDWRNARQLKMTESEHKRKIAAIDAYVKPCAPCGKPWSGVLPKIFVNANRWNRELYFKVR